MVFATLSHGLVTLSSTYCFPWWFLPLCATRVLSFIYFGLSGFPLSLVYSLVVFATLCRQGFVMLFFNWWFSTFNCLFPGGFCHSVPPGLCHVIFQLVVFHFHLFIPWWFLPLCAARALSCYFSIGGFPLSIVYSLVVFATLCHQGCRIEQ